MVATDPVATSAAGTLAVTTCLKTMALTSSGERLSKVPSGSFPNASSEGAKTVKASAFFKVSTKPRSETILTNVVKDPAPTATSTTSPSSSGSACLLSASGSASVKAALVAGRMTLSMTWMTPLLAMTSAATTLTVFPL